MINTAVAVRKKDAVGYCFVDRAGGNGIDGGAPNDSGRSAAVEYVADLVQIAGTRSGRAVRRNVCDIVSVVVRVKDEGGARGALIGHAAIGREQDVFVHSVVAGARRHRSGRAGSV